MDLDFKDLEDFYFQKKYSNAYQLACDLASEGNIKGIRFLGWMHFRGHGCQQNEEMAMSFFRKAADNGDAEASYGIAAIYFDRKEYRQAVQYLEEAMVNGYVPAIRWAGTMYQLGLGVEKDLHKAYDLYKKAAQAGSLTAYCHQAHILLHGFRGFAGRVKSIPMLIKFYISAFSEAIKNPNSQRLM